MQCVIVWNQTTLFVLALGKKNLLKKRLKKLIVCTDLKYLQKHTKFPNDDVQNNAKLSLNIPTLLSKIWREEGTARGKIY